MWIVQIALRRPYTFVVLAVFGLEDYERFVFVMSVLEHYSQHNCALLLGCSVLEVRKAHTAALNNLGHTPHMDRSQKPSVRAGEELK